MRLHVEHTTRYMYERPVTFGRHRLVLRPREGHELRLTSMELRLEPAHHLRWIRDVFGNSIALVDWLEPAASLTIVNDVVVERFAPFPTRDLHEPWRVRLPAEYEPAETAIVAAYLAPSFADSETPVRVWLHGGLTVDPLDAEGTMLALAALVRQSITYQRRTERGVQSPARTLELGSGSCRDMATLMMDAARLLGVAARFASGYLHGAASIAGLASTHAWTEVYLPALGWRGLDPTLGTAITLGHVAVGVSSHPRGVMPVSGAFVGEGSDYRGLEVTVKTEELMTTG
jgi:transglutaminase-like putative cysteine protease